MEFGKDGVISEEENRHLEGHMARTREILNTLIPRLPLDWVAMLVRVGLAVLLFILLIAPPYTYLRATFLSPVTVSQSSATGTVSVREYTPELQVSVNDVLWTRRDIDGPVQFTSLGDFSGMTAGVAPATVNGATGVAVYWTEPVNGKLVLKKLVTDDFFRGEKTASSTLWDDQNFLSADVVSTGSVTLVAAAYETKSLGVSHPKLALQTFDLHGESVHPRVDVDLPSGESLGDIQVLPWGSGWALVTHIPKGPDEPLFSPSKVELRLFDSSLAFTEHLEFGIVGYEIGGYPTVLPPKSDVDGYTVVATAHPSIRSRTDPAGDRLFAFQFDNALAIRRILRLTNNGGQHDFAPTGYELAPNGDYVIGIGNVVGGGFDDEKVFYPKDSGRSYLRFFDRSMQVAGTVIVYDDPALKDLADQRGAAHVRQVLIGDRMFVAFDMLSNESAATGKPERTVQGMWFRLVRQ